MADLVTLKKVPDIIYIHFCDQIITLFDGLGPYDAIHVGAAAATVPSALIEQLASPGRMFIPVGTFMQFIEQIDKDVAGNVSRRQVMGVRVRLIQELFILHSFYRCGSSFSQYVPLTDRHKQLRDRPSFEWL